MFFRNISKYIIEEVSGDAANNNEEAKEPDAPQDTSNTSSNIKVKNLTKGG